MEQKLVNYELTVRNHDVINTSTNSANDLFVKICQELYQNSLHQPQNKRHLIFKAATGVGKSTEFIFQLHQTFRCHTIICVQATNYNVYQLHKVLVNKYPIQLKDNANIGKFTGIMKQMPNERHSIIYTTSGAALNKFLLPYIQPTFLDETNNIGTEQVIFVIDEAHSNQVEHQLLLAVARQIIQTNQIQPIFIIQSASIDINKMKQYFENEFSMEVIGRRNQIVEFYMDDLFSDYSAQKTFTIFTVSICQAILQKLSKKLNAAVNSINCNADGSILIFVIGVKMSNSIATALNNMLQTIKKEVPIYELSRDSLEKNQDLYNLVQQDIQKIIISTNIAETGATFPHISFVIDCLKHKSSSYNPVLKTQQTRVLPICKSMQLQRKGRAGRMTDGIYIAFTTKQIGQQLMEEREKSIQIQDIKQNIQTIGVEMFSNLTFSNAIPGELYLDVLQAQILFGGNAKINTMHQKITGIQRVKVQHRALIYFAMIKQIKLSQIMGLIAYIESIRRKSDIQEFNENKPQNDFLDIIKDVEARNFEVNKNFLDIFQDMVTFCINNKIDIFAGQSILSQPNMLLDIVINAFQQQIFYLQSNNTTYMSKYGTFINTFNKTPKKLPPVIITNQTLDNYNIQPQFVADITHMQNKAQINIQQYIKAHQKQN